MNNFLKYSAQNKFADIMKFVIFKASAASSAVAEESRNCQ